MAEKQRRVVLTDARVRALASAEPGKRYDVLDALMPGLLVRVTDKGRKTLMYRARFPSNKANDTTGKKDAARRAIGEFGKLTLDQARDKARSWHELVSKGIDPQEDQMRIARAEQARKRDINPAPKLPGLQPCLLEEAGTIMGVWKPALRAWRRI